LAEPDYLCVVPWCKNPALDAHHIWRRTALGRAFNCVLDKDTGDVLTNIADVCRSHHNDLTDNRAQIKYDAELKAYFWQSLAPIPDTPYYGPLDVEALSVPLSEPHGTTLPETVVLAERTVTSEQARESVSRDLRPLDEADLTTASTLGRAVDKRPPHKGAAEFGVATEAESVVISESAPGRGEAGPNEHAGLPPISTPPGPGTPTRGIATLGDSDAFSGASGGREKNGPVPGSTCELCKRKVPHPRKSDSPVSRVKAFRIPADEREAFEGLLGAAEEIVGVHSQPFATYKVLLAALALVVQSPGEVRELLERRAA
jgi:hypothetical protein